MVERRKERPFSSTSRRPPDTMDAQDEEKTRASDDRLRFSTCLGLQRGTPT